MKSNKKSLLFIIHMLVFMFSFYKIISIKIEEHRAKITSNNLKEQINQNKGNIIKENIHKDVDGNTDKNIYEKDEILSNTKKKEENFFKSKIENKSKDDIKLKSKYKDIYDRNKDFMAWINIPDTPIDYPIMNTPNNPNYY